MLLLFLALLPFAHATRVYTCPDGFDLVRDGQCRGIYKSMNIKDSEAATKVVDICKEMDAQPVSMHSDEDKAYWAKKSPSTRLLLGLECNTTSNEWNWADGSPVDYGVSPNGCSTGCAWFINSGGAWTKWCDGDVEAFDVGCTTQVHQLIPESDGCEYFAQDTDDGVCYQVGENAESWQEAQLNCRKLGANLASIHTPQENSFLRRLAISRGAVNGLFLGATISGKGDEYSWIDGTAWDYNNFFPGFPMPGFGECVAMDTTESSGQWMNIDCAAKLPVACIRNTWNISEPNATCNRDPWKEGQLITSPGFPITASTECDFFMTVDAGKRVELEIILLLANSCCDKLIIYDGYLGSPVLATLTGQVTNTTFTTTTSNIMRVTWEPNGGVNVIGLAMTFRAV